GRDDPDTGTTPANGERDGTPWNAGTTPGMADATTRNAGTTPETADATRHDAWNAGKSLGTAHATRRPGTSRKQWQHRDAGTAVRQDAKNDIRNGRRDATT